MSGTTSKEELCLVVENGHVHAEGVEVLLEPCSAAVAAGDGRELWQFMPDGQIVSVFGRLCIGSKEDPAHDGGVVILMHCDASSDGRTKWEVQANGQIKNGPMGMCMTQRGSAAGFENLAASSAAVASSSADVVAHGANMAVDGKDSSYWASKLDAEQPQTFTIDFGSKKKLHHAVVTWEFPAKSFVMSLSTDGSTWSDAFAIDTNVMNVSRIPLGYQYATKAKITMYETHLRYGKYQSHSVYGIKSIAFYTPRLRTSIEDCATAATSSDARDKYFLSYINEFDESFSSKALRSELPVLTAAQQSLSSILGELTEVMQRVQPCYKKQASLLRNTSKHGELFAGHARVHSNLNSLVGETTKSAFALSSPLGTPAVLSRKMRAAIDEQNGFDKSCISALLAEARDTIIAARSILFSN